MGLIDRIRTGAYVPTPGPPLASSGATTTLAETGARVAAGMDVLAAVREFLDQVDRREDDELALLIRDAPVATGSAEGDALLAGVAEHVSATRNLPCPAWTQDTTRFLDRFWFVSDVPGFRAIALAQSPIALKRRGVLWSARSLQRV
jgi:hypothetical protein